MPLLPLRSFARQTHTLLRPLRSWLRLGRGGAGLAVALVACLANPGQAAQPAPAASSASSAAARALPSSAAPSADGIGAQVRQAVQGGTTANKRITLIINGKEKKYITMPALPAIAPAPTPAEAPAAAAGKVSQPSAAARPLGPKPVAAAVNPQASRRDIRARASALSTQGAGGPAAAAPGGVAPWGYEGVTGPQAWGKLAPEFELCATGKRQSPIHIDAASALQGPAEPLQFNYQPSAASVVNNGYTIEVEVAGANTLSVRGTSYQLQQIKFHHPSEERINNQGFAMAAHLLHKSADGRLAVLAVLLQSGAANALIHKVWTYMPLDVGDRVPMPAGLLDLNELLPQDQRYYQFMGSLSTPPCTEGVLWLVLKQPATASPQQVKLFAQLFPNNARPIQPLHGRTVRDAQ